NSQRVLLGTNHLYESTNQGDTWQSLTAFPTPGNVTDIAIAPTDPNTIYSATVGGNIYVSTDDGATWTTATRPAVNYAFEFRIVVDPRAANTAYAFAPRYAALT